MPGFVGVLLIFASVLWSSAVVTNFRGEPGHNKVVLKWTTISEVHCKEYVIERSLDKQTFNKIGSVRAKGNMSERTDYQYEDKTVFRAASNTFHYRLRIIDQDGTETKYSEIVTVTPAISGVRHTWGSIKAMFR